MHCNCGCNTELKVTHFKMFFIIPMDGSSEDLASLVKDGTVRGACPCASFAKPTLEDTKDECTKLKFLAVQKIILNFVKTSY